MGKTVRVKSSGIGVAWVITTKEPAPEWARLAICRVPGIRVHLRVEEMFREYAGGVLYVRDAGCQPEIMSWDAAMVLLLVGEPSTSEHGVVERGAYRAARPEDFGR